MPLPRDIQVCKHGVRTDQHVCYDCEDEKMDAQLKTISSLKKDKFRKELICAALTGLVDSMEYFPEKLAKEAIGYADAVLKILEEEDERNN